jgi:hypothetical protein
MNEDQWEKIDCNKALDALIDAYHFKSESGKNYLINFIKDVELIKRSQVKQVPALFKKEN